MAEKIDESQFNAWKDHTVTKEIFKALNLLRNDVNEELTNSQVIMKEGSEKVLARKVGQREGIDLILNISIENLEEDQHED